MFNLSTDPWITVRRLDGTLAETGFLGLLQQAHDIRSIETGWLASDNAVMDYALAIAYRALDAAPGPLETATSKIARYFEHGSLSDEIGDYLGHYDKSFDLNRFGQVQDAVVLDAKGVEQTRKLSRLFVNIPAPGNPTENSRPGRISTLGFTNEPSIPEVALALVTTLRYDTPKSGALASQRGVPYTFDANSTMGGRGLGSFPRLMLRGSSFAETLLLNMPPQTSAEKTKDFAAWEVPGAETEIYPRVNVPLSGYADWLTYQGRTIRLIWEGDQPVSVVIAANNFAINCKPGLTGASTDKLAKGIKGQKDEPPYSRTSAFLSASPYGVWRESAKTDVEPIEFIPAGDARDAWFGIRAFTAQGGGGLIHAGANLNWIAELEDAGLVPKSSPLVAEYSRSIYGNNNSYLKAVVGERYPMRAWLSSKAARRHRARIDDAFARVSQSAYLLRMLDEDLREPGIVGSSSKPKGKVVVQASGLEAAFVSRAAPSLHRLIASIEVGEDPEKVAKRFADVLSADVEASFAHFDARLTPERLGADHAAAYIARKKERVMSIIDPVIIDEQEAEAADEIVKKPRWSPPPRNEAETSVKRRAYATLSRGRDSASVRVSLARLNGQKLDRHPELAIEVMRAWGPEIPEHLQDAADQAVSDACSMWAKSGKDISGAPVMRIASRLAAREATTDGFVAKSVRRILSSGDPRATVHAVDHLVRYFASKGERIDYSDLAADLYLLSTEPKKARIRWAKLYSTGKA